MANIMKGLGGAASGAAAGAALGPWGAAIGGVGGGLLGLLSGDDNQDQINALQKAQYDKINSLQTPDINELQLKLDQYRSAGQLTPEQEQAILQQASEMKNISTDPRLKQAQMSALAKLQGLGDTGLSDEDRAALGSINRNVAQQSEARQQSILQNMAARGMGGAGAELAAQLASSQQGADMANQQGQSIAAQAQAKALQAIMNAGTLGGQMQGQEFNQQAQIAQAQDAINRFNAQNQQAVNMRNVQAANAAQQYNLQNNQNIMNQNTALGNYQQEHNKQLAVDDYNRKLAQAQAAAGAAGTYAGNMQKQQDASNQGFANTMAGIGTAAQGIAGLAKQKPANPPTYDYSQADGFGNGITEKV